MPVTKPVKPHLSKAAIISRNKDIVTFLQMGFSPKEIADSYGVTAATVYSVRKNYNAIENNHVVSYAEISKKLDIPIEEVKSICDKFLTLSRERFAEKEINYEDLCLG